MAKKSDKVIETVKKYIQLLSKEIAVEKVILFGSYIRGDYDQESDIDLAVISLDFKKKNYLENIQFLSRKGAELDTIIEAFPYTPEEYETQTLEAFWVKSKERER